MFINHLKARPQKAPVHKISITYESQMKMPYHLLIGLSVAMAGSLHQRVADLESHCCRSEQREDATGNQTNHAINTSQGLQMSQ